MIRIPYLHCPVPLTLAVMVAFLVTLAVLKPLTAQSGQSSTADTTISSETQSPDSEPNRAQPTSAPDKGNIDSVTDVEIQRRFNELQRELLYDRHEFLDKRAKDVDWWLTAIVVFLTLTAVFLTFFAIVVAIIGIFGFQRFREIEKEARQSVEALKEQEKQAGLAVEGIQAKREEADSLLKGMNAETTHNDPDKASEVVETVQQNPAASLIDRARCRCYLTAATRKGKGGHRKVAFHRQCRGRKPTSSSRREHGSPSAISTVREPIESRS